MVGISESCPAKEGALGCIPIIRVLSSFGAGRGSRREGAAFAPVYNMHRVLAEGEIKLENITRSLAGECDAQEPSSLSSSDAADWSERAFSLLGALAHAHERAYAAGLARRILSFDEPRVGVGPSRREQKKRRAHHGFKIPETVPPQLRI